MITNMVQRQNAITRSVYQSTQFKVCGERSIVGRANASFATSGSATSFADKIHQEMLKFKVAPSTWFYFLNYSVLPSQVKATGPRGHLTKADVTNFIASNKLQKKPVVDETESTDTKAPQ